DTIYFFYSRTCKPRRVQQSHIHTWRRRSTNTHSSHTQRSSNTLSLFCLLLQFPLRSPNQHPIDLLSPASSHTQGPGTAAHSRIYERVRRLNGDSYRGVNMLRDRVLVPEAELLIPILCQRPDQRHRVRRQSPAGFHGEGQQLGAEALGDVVVLVMLVTLLIPCHIRSGVCATGLGGISPSITRR